MTSGRDTGQPEVAGGLARHIPVLVRTVVDLLNVRAGATYIDATFGAGGYTRALLVAANCRVIAIDRDHTAIAAGSALAEEFGGRLALIEGRFSDLDQAVDSAGSIDGVVLDLGVSSMQLDTAERGFSFRLDGPLDMRMGGEGATAAEIVAKASEHDLAAIISTLGEERHARAVARAIVRARTEPDPRHQRAGRDRGARRSFPSWRHPPRHPHISGPADVRQQQLGELAQALIAAERVLKAGGRLVVVAFHSLEDRVVKTYFTSRSGSHGGSRHLPDPVKVPATSAFTKRPLVPDEAECAGNPRARSAKLRAGERTDAPPLATDVSGLPRLPQLADVLRQR